MFRGYHYFLVLSSVAMLFNLCLAGCGVLSKHKQTNQTDLQVNNTSLHTTENNQTTVNMTVLNEDVRRPSEVLRSEDPGTKSHNVYLEKQSSQFDTVHIPTNKINYEPVKLVFIRTEEDQNSTGGPYLTYLELLQQADKLGAHDIINVRIERTENCVKTVKKEPECKNVRFGSALAIRYTKPITLKDLESTTSCKSSNNVSEQQSTSNTKK